MESIYHEKQEGSLCAVHCLNVLLQDTYFSAVDLVELANRMDAAEQHRMAERGTDTTEYRTFIQQGSNNMDDTGMFSIQVVMAALEVFALTLVPFRSAEAARRNPASKNAYICNMREHWFTIRRLGRQWFNLNSLLAYPELLSDTYVTLFLAQLQQQGYSIYVVEGCLPDCPADLAILVLPVTQSIKPPLLSELASQQSSGTSAAPTTAEETDVAAAVSASFAGTEEEGNLERALQMSLTEHLTKVPIEPPPEEDLEKAIRLSLISSERGDLAGDLLLGGNGDDDGRAASAKALVELRDGCPASNSTASASASTSSTSASADVETIRNRRLQFFEKKSSESKLS